MKYLAILTILLTALTLKSCSFNDSEMVYEEKLVVFASISANLPVLDTVLVSKQHKSKMRLWQMICGSIMLKLN